MAKLDANGRPIYETAEEYNKAHHTGSARRTYDSPEGENYKHTTYKQVRNFERTVEKQKASSPKKKTKIILICAVVFMLVNMVIVMLMFNMVQGTVNGVYESYEDDRVDYEDAEEYEEFIGDADTPLYEEFNTIKYQGVSYTIPMTYDEFSQMGFTLEEAYDEESIISAEGYEHLIINNEEDDMIGIIRVRNTTREEVPLNECVIDYFSIDNPSAYDAAGETIDFVFGMGFTMESSYEELELCFGAPYYQYVTDDESGCYESYEWLYRNGSQYQCIAVSFWDGVITNVAIENAEY